MFGLQWYDILLVVIVFLLFFTSIRKIQKNAKNGCSHNCYGCSAKDCPSKNIVEDKKK